MKKINSSVKKQASVNKKTSINLLTNFFILFPLIFMSFFSKAETPYERSAALKYYYKYYYKKTGRFPILQITRTSNGENVNLSTVKSLEMVLDKERNLFTIRKCLFQRKSCAIKGQENRKFEKEPKKELTEGLGCQDLVPNKWLPASEKSFATFNYYLQKNTADGIKIENKKRSHSIFFSSLGFTTGLLSTIVDIIQPPYPVKIGASPYSYLKFLKHHPLGVFSGIFTGIFAYDLYKSLQNPIYPNVEDLVLSANPSLKENPSSIEETEEKEKKEEREKLEELLYNLHLKAMEKTLIELGEDLNPERDFPSQTEASPEEAQNNGADPLPL